MLAGLGKMAMKQKTYLLPGKQTDVTGSSVFNA